ncbi:hypothetical protein CDD82_5293 [Ophiocordyceps australis]|uniref:BTB domain-containing protein n=1 Tax=Ophiocordyceps australis TaxID=1399860 RepID=A0A2C5Z261_9HYPO|nr:hypothetical protein CDD82_5293 [Ophiocordyceps australis]
MTPPPKSLTAAKQPVGKTVVPVLPLSRVKRSAPSKSIAVHSRPPHDATRRPDEANGRLDTKAAIVSSYAACRPEVGHAAQVDNPVGQETEEKGSASYAVSTPSLNSIAPAPADQPALVASSQTVTLDATADAYVASIAQAQTACNGSLTALQSEHSMERQASDASSQTPSMGNGCVGEAGPSVESAEHGNAQTSAPSILPPRYAATSNLGPMPSFPPVNRPPGILGQGDFFTGPQPGPPAERQHIHQAHLSNGSIHFGAFHDSQSSSPAPPISGGIPPPPGLPGLEGRAAPINNPISPVAPYGADPAQVANMDAFARPAVGYAVMDSYPPYGANYGPHTPLSFQDASSPNLNEDAMFGQLGPGTHGNGDTMSANAFRAPDAPNAMLRPLNYHRMIGDVGPQPMVPFPDNGDGLIGYIQQLFGSSDLADCTLEFGQLDDGAPLMRIPAHRIILSRSPKLSTVLPMSKHGSIMPTLLLKVDSRWVRSDSLYMAVQRLYGLPLLMGPPPNQAYMGETVQVGSGDQQFDFSLSYAAAGDLLGLGPVVRRGCEVATQLLNWHTLERGLEFALDDLVDYGTHESYRYGDGSRTLLDAVAAFVLQSMPPKFELVWREEELGSECRYARFPTYPQASAEVGAEAAATQTPAVQLGRGRRPQQIANIQFGDLSISEDGKCTGSETHGTSNEAPPVQHVVLSRVLLNLPFTYLRIIAESSGPMVSSGETRRGAIKQAVKQREARRAGGLKAVLDGRVGDSDAILRALESPSPKSIGGWTALGWREEVVQRGSSESLSVQRSWVPVVRQQSRGTRQFP